MSRAFYPFPHDDNHDADELVDRLQFSLMEKAGESVDIKTRVFAENKDEIVAASLEMAKALHRGECS